MLCSRSSVAVPNVPTNMHQHLDCVEINSDGGLMLSSSCLNTRTWSGSLWYFDNPDAAPDPERCAAGVDVSSGIMDMLWVPGSDRIVTASDSGAVSLWELIDDRHTVILSAEKIEHDNIVTSVSLNADNTKVISASYDQSIKIWDTTQMGVATTYKAHCDIVNCVACHPSDPNKFISCGQDGRLLMWDTRLSKPATTIDTEALPAMTACVAWVPEKEHVAVFGTETGVLVIQDTRHSVGTPVVIPAHSRYINKLKFSPHKPNWVASASDDCTVVVTDVALGKAFDKDAYHQDFVKGLCWEPVSHRLFSCGWDMNVGGRLVQQPETLSSPLATMEITSNPVSSNQPDKMETTNTPLQQNGTESNTKPSQQSVDAKG